MYRKEKPDYTSFGYSLTMGPQLRALVEEQLTADLAFYGVENTDVRFDWSESCIEGHDTTYLDGSLENFSSIVVFDKQDNCVADGWMEFVHDGDFFIAYWEFITTWNKNQVLKTKEKVGIPEHVWKKIPDDIKWTCEKDRMNQ